MHISLAKIYKQQGYNGLNLRQLLYFCGIYESRSPSRGPTSRTISLHAGSAFPIPASLILNVPIEGRTVL